MVDTLIETADPAPPAVAGDPGTSAGAGIWGPAHRMLTLGLILTVAGSAFAALAVATTMPATIRDLGGLAFYGWAFSAFMLANLIGTTFAGGEADRSGPARPFVLGVVLFALGLLTAGLAPTMIVFVAGRVVQGFGAGVVGSVAYVAIGRGYPEAAKPRMLAMLATAWVVPGLVGPGLAGLIADQAGWRWVFLGLAALHPLAASLALPMLRRLTIRSATPRDWRRVGAAARLALGAGLVLTGIDMKALPLLVLLVGAGLALGWPALRRLLPADPLPGAAHLPAAIATSGVLSFAFFGADAFVPLTLTAVRGQTITSAGLALTAATLCWTVGAWVQARGAPRYGRRLLVLTGLGLIALGVAGLVGLLDPGVPVFLAPVAWGVAGLGMGLAFSTISLVVLESARPGQEGSSAAAMQLTNVLGEAFGTGLGGVILWYATAEGGSPRPGLAIHDLVMIGALGIGVVAATRLPGRPRPAAAPAPIACEPG